MISEQERAKLSEMLVLMRASYDELTVHDAGVCLLHLEAAIAALESHLKRDGASLIDELRHDLMASRRYGGV